MIWSAFIFGHRTNEWYVDFAEIIFLAYIIVVVIQHQDNWIGFLLI